MSTECGMQTFGREMWCRRHSGCQGSMWCNGGTGERGTGRVHGRPGVVPESSTNCKVSVGGFRGMSWTL